MGTDWLHAVSIREILPLEPCLQQGFVLYIAFGICGHVKHVSCHACTEHHAHDTVVAAV
jgi:hypothetical protein